MRIVNATFVNNYFEPGWQIMDDDVPIGKQYQIDLERTKSFTIVNPSLGKTGEFDCVYVVSPGVPGYLPLMALKIEADV